MGLSNKQKDYLKNHVRSSSLEKIAKKLKVDQKELEEYLKRIWRRDKYNRIVKKRRLKKRKIKTKNNFKIKQFFKKNWWQALLIALVGLAVYANSLDNAFLSDDIGAIAKNQKLDTFTYVTQSPMSFLRPLMYFAINKMFGRVPWAFRSINIFFHLGNGLLLLILGKMFIGQFGGLLAGLLFIVHPLLIESVTWISGGPYSQYTFFVLLAFLLYILAEKNHKYHKFSIAAYFLALFTSAKAIPYPGLLFAYELSRGHLKKNWRKLVTPIIITAIWTGTLILKIPKRLQTLETQHYQKSKTLNPLFQIPAAISSYIIMFFFPKNLTLYHSEMAFNDLEFTGRLILTLFYLGLLAYTFFKEKWRHYFFWLAFFGVSLLPMLTPFGISWIVAERYVYLGTVGLVFTISLLLSRLFKNNRTFGILILTAIVIALGVRTVIRNNDWQNQDKLWLAAAKTSPNSPQNNNNLGDMYARWGEYEKSLEHYRRAIKLKPGYADAYHNMAITYRKMGEIDKAIAAYQKALELNPRLWQSCQDLAVIYYQQENYEEAVTWAKKAVDLNPTNPKMYANLAILYEKWGKPEKALKVVTKGLAVNRDNSTLRGLYARLQKNNAESNSD